MTLSRKLSGIVVLAVVSSLTFGCGRKAAPNAEADRNRRFAESMSGVTLVGHSTRTNREGLSKEERYQIDSVTHIAGDTWLFRSRLKYEGHDLPVPIPITVLWAGDTPVITLTDLSIPGVGTFTARVLLYRDQYAGTWSGKNAGGQMFGRITRAPSASHAPNPPTSAETAQ